VGISVSAIVVVVGVCLSLGVVDDKRGDSDLNCQLKKQGQKGADRRV